MPKFINRVGQRFGSLTVLEEDEPAYTKSGTLLRRWKCKCDCGNIVTVFASNLTSGHSTRCKKCGLEVTSEKHKTHGMRHTRLYKTWASMKTRCYNRNSAGYKKYGAVGITMCDEWIEDGGFENFANWAMSNGFIEDAEPHTNTIDRIDNNLGYSPENCRIVDSAIQSNNREFCITLTDVDGETLTLKQLARKHNMNYQTLHSRWARGKRTYSEIMKPTVRKSAKHIAPFIEH